MIVTIEFSYIRITPYSNYLALKKLHFLEKNFPRRVFTLKKQSHWIKPSTFCRNNLNGCFSKPLKGKVFGIYRTKYDSKYLLFVSRFYLISDFVGNSLLGWSCIASFAFAAVTEYSALLFYTSVLHCFTHLFK